MPTVAVLSVGNTAHGIVDLIILLGLLFLDFYAVTKIITKAGYSSKWILLPLTPVILAVPDPARPRRQDGAHRQLHRLPAGQPVGLCRAPGSGHHQRDHHLGLL